MKNYNFAIIGCAGYVAPRHLEAIKATENNLLAAVDKSDSVGILDKYFDDVTFFTEFERFDRYIEKIKRKEKQKIDFVSICSPNYLHDAHVRFAFRTGANAICEKPLVLNPWNLDELEELEKETGKKVFTILQLRHHPAILALKEKVEKEFSGKKYDINLKYITPRGKWYHYSWKGDVSKSGGIATNIGVHLFDMLLWIFGKVEDFKVLENKKDKMKGTLSLKKANVNWLLSIDKKDLPKEAKTSFRSLTIDNEEFEFSEGFTDLHTTSYKEILAGRGYGIKDVKPVIELVSKIRNAIPLEE